MFELSSFLKFLVIDKNIIGCSVLGCTVPIGPQRDNYATIAADHCNIYARWIMRA